MKLVGISTVALALAACGTILEPAPNLTRIGDTNFEITVNPGGIERNEDNNGFHVRATVRNVSGRDFFANVGDGFNSALDQETIFAALGTHASVERRVGADTWISATAAALVEGSRFVVLKAGKTYTLFSSVNAVSGTYRISFSYSDVNNDESATLPFRDYSASFTIP